MRKLLTFLCAALMSVGMWAANSGSCGPNLTWNYAAGALTISGTGDMYDYGQWDNTAPWYDKRFDITSVTIGNSVTSIGNCAFYSCPNVPSVTIPNGVTSIGNYAFTGWNELTSIVIPNSVTSIGREAFNGCGKLTSLTIGNSVESIGPRAFRECRKLTSIEIPNSVTSIGQNAFDACTGLTSLTIGNSVTSIADAAFVMCKGLTSITIPSSVTSIGADAFKSCDKITDVYCYPNPADLTWNDKSCDDFKSGRATKCHVPADYLAAYVEKFGATVNVTFDQITEEVATNEDPENTGVYYYSTFYHSTQKYALTNDGTTAFVADLSGSDLLLTKIAEGTDVIPANTAVIFRKAGSAEPVVLVPTDAAEPVSVTATNSLQGTDVAVATPDNCYVLSGHSSDNSVTGVGFYRYEGTNLNPHKAYVVFGGSSAPRRMRFIFAEEQTATGTENASADNDESQKRMENGVLVVIRNGVRYNAQGQIVK